MNVGELIQQLSKYDKSLPIYVPSALGNDYDYGKAHTVKSENMSIEDSEEHPDQTLVIVIDEV